VLAVNLCIADPPYLGRAAVWYGAGMSKSQLSKDQGGTSKKNGIKPADYHPDAHLWDDINKHQQMVEMLIDTYDGWAIAMAHDNLRDYIPLIPKNIPIRIGIWTKPQTMPGGARVVNAYEPVILRIPEGRKSSTGKTIFPRDSVTISRINNGFPGAKPPAWTRWVLDMLGYDQETDTVDDLFEGSGAVAKELAQGVLL
jgi:hypothetical protein